MVRVASHFSEIVLSKLLEKLKASMNRLYEERERISCNMGHIIWPYYMAHKKWFLNNIIDLLLMLSQNKIVLQGPNDITCLLVSVSSNKSSLKA